MNKTDVCSFVECAIRNLPCEIVNGTHVTIGTSLESEYERRHPNEDFRVTGEKVYNLALKALSSTSIDVTDDEYYLTDLVKDVIRKFSTTTHQVTFNIVDDHPVIDR